jgi:hypothetical protein
VTEKLLPQGSRSTSLYEMKKFKIENEITNKGDMLCTYVNLISKPQNTFLLTPAGLLIKMAFKYGFMVKKDNKHVNAIFNILSNFNLGK